MSLRAKVIYNVYVDQTLHACRGLRKTKLLIKKSLSKSLYVVTVSSVKTPDQLASTTLFRNSPQCPLDNIGLF